MIALPKSAPSPKAYSYLRFSTPEQMRGDSFRRQTALADAYAAQHGLTLDDTLHLHDIGVSAFRGRNAIVGNLGKFIEHVHSGEVPQGSVLLVESLDRLSRQEVATAQLSFLNLLQAGVRVVTLLDGQEYSWESANGTNGVQLIISLLLMSRAHEESATKARRLKEAWSAKRSRLDTQPLTSKVPAWLRLDPDSMQLELIPERQPIVERIFRETLEGKGQHLIANSLNREGVKPWGRGAYWQRSYIAKILDSEAVIGTFTPHTLDYADGKKTRTPQDRVEGYFPAAIPEHLWNEVRAFRDRKQPKARGRNASAPITNMLAGLASCPLCGSTMTRTNKGARSKPSYVCVRAKSKAGCSYRSVRVELVEAAILERLPERLRDAPAGERDPELDRQIVNLEGKLQGIERDIETTKNAVLLGGEAQSLVSMLRELDGAFEATRGELRKLADRRAATAGQTVHARISRLLAALEPEEGQPEAQAVNLALQTVFRRVAIDYRHGVLDFEWLHGGKVEVPYSLPSD